MCIEWSQWLIDVTLVGIGIVDVKSGSFAVARAWAHV
jgi:hypothetical protein